MRPSCCGLPYRRVTIHRRLNLVCAHLYVCVLCVCATARIIYFRFLFTCFRGSWAGGFTGAPSSMMSPSFCWQHCLPFTSLRCMYVCVFTASFAKPVQIALRLENSMIRPKLLQTRFSLTHFDAPPVSGHRFKVSFFSSFLPPNHLVFLSTLLRFFFSSVFLEPAG